MIRFSDKGLFISGFYLHGQIENIIGYDLVGCNTNDISIGIHQCYVNEYSCIYYSWYRKYGQCGLICLESDIPANSYALIKYNKKADII